MYVHSWWKMILILIVSWRNQVLILGFSCFRWKKLIGEVSGRKHSISVDLIIAIHFREDCKNAVSPGQFKVVDTRKFIRLFINFTHHWWRYLSHDFYWCRRKKLVRLYWTYRTIVLSRVDPASVHLRALEVNIRLELSFFWWTLHSVHITRILVFFSKTLK